MSGDEAAVWDRFYATFDFRPSMRRFPAITEPTPSATRGSYRCACFGGDLLDLVEADLNEVLGQVMRRDGRQVPV
ncbi:DUF2716 domain-containing protein [Micromonospora sp. WMMD975]|uniref:DUF2716 domain-containing protein n=1 Tax=Micromonospora sp. WMMD975 TaxID=3016087 RepID=UPI00249AB955|nr:DUF2716 domain-containing protein [Micromonospora sp. WMMD975]WFE30992.1 DUF2716 domain-containing protein [Micromonospora sp. WMMD975]